MEIPAQDNSTIIIVATIVSALVASLAKIIESVMPLITEWFKKRSGEKRERLSTDMHKNAESRKLMQRLIDTNDKTDRIILWELSNGESVFTSTHLWKLRYYDEVSRGSVIKVKPLYLNQLINLIHYSELIQQLGDKQVVFVNDVSQLENQVLRDTFSGSGVKSFYLSLITDLYDNPIGLLTVESIHNYSNFDQHYKEKIESISAMLSAKI